MFEDLCREHVRATLGSTATRVGRWWGNSLHSLRRSKERTTEEIDVVGTSRKRVTVVGEVKWTSRPLSSKILGDLTDYKIPALEQDGFKLARQLTTDQPDVAVATWPRLCGATTCCSTVAPADPDAPRTKSEGDRHASDDHH